MCSVYLTINVMDESFPYWAKVAICGQQGEDLLEKRLIEVGEGEAVGEWGTLVEVKRAAERT